MSAQELGNEIYTLRVNGQSHPVKDAWIGESLLYVLRERLGLPGAKGACEQGECGSCTVVMDSQAVCSCLVMAAAAVETLSTEIDAALANAGSPPRNGTVDADVTYFCTADVAKLFGKSRQWVTWALRNNVFVRKDGTPIEPVRLGKSTRRRFTPPLLRDMAKAAYRRGILDEVELEGVLGELARVER